MKKTIATLMTLATLALMTSSAVAQRSFTPKRRCSTYTVLNRTNRTVYFNLYRGRRLRKYQISPSGQRRYRSCFRAPIVSFDSIIGDGYRPVRKRLTRRSVNAFDRQGRRLLLVTGNDSGPTPNIAR